VALDFHGAFERFSERQRLIVEEAAAISTAYGYVDLLPSGSREKTQEYFRTYLARRLEFTRQSLSYSILEGAVDYSRHAKAQVVEAEKAIREEVRSVCAGPRETVACMLLLPSLDRMFEMTLGREGANYRHPPRIFFVMLFATGLAASLLVGFGMARTGARSSVHMGAFALLLSTTLYAITDLEFPRFGLMRVDSLDHFLEESLTH
jgi:hypothetical protein